MVPFQFSENYILEDDVVLLRPLQLTDFEFLRPFAVHEREIWKYSLVQVAGEENMRKYIQDALKAKEDKKEYPFIVFDKRTQQYAGSTRFYDIQLEHRTLQLGYTWYGKSFQGTGLNKHCKYLLLQFAFDHIGMERVEFRADNRNEKSIAAMKSIGCTVEGVLRQNYILPDETRRDSIILSILRSEWEKYVKDKLFKKL
jgi:RimJ/RimL family protein N-acetyltransferase